jgi:hypothetical protein
MRPLTAADIVKIWDQGQAWHPVDRALLLLAYALPELPAEELLALSVGQRNLRLLRTRQLTIGDRLDGLVTCPKCGESLEFNVQVTQLLLPEPEIQVQELALDAWRVRYRLPNSLDLAALLSSQLSLPAARQMLIERCLLVASQDGENISSGDLPEKVILQVANAISEADPLADMRFTLTCQACGHEWSATFDIVTFFWEELAAQAKRLLREVHQLARAYGWRESEILAMSGQRRHTYLEFVGA